jgi:hypothetical protein
MNHLRRLERSLLAGAAAAAVAGIWAVTREKQEAAQAASSHMTLTRFMATGLIGLMLITAATVFIISTVAARGRRTRGSRRRSWSRQ